MAVHLPYAVASVWGKVSSPSISLKCSEIAPPKTRRPTRTHAGSGGGAAGNLCLGGTFSDRSHEGYYGLSASIRCKKDHTGEEARKVKKLKGQRRDMSVSALAMGVSQGDQGVMKVKGKKKKGKRDSDSSSSSSSSSSSESEKEMARHCARRQRGPAAVMDKPAVAGKAVTRAETSLDRPLADGLGSYPVGRKPVVLPASEFTNPFLNFALLEVGKDTDEVFSTFSPAGSSQPSKALLTASTSLASASTWVESTKTPTSAPSFSVPVLTGEVEVCLGGKCKRGGAEEILASLQYKAASGGFPIAVSSCKCMGKCKSAPNVRLWKGEAETPITESTMSVEDVDDFLSRHFGFLGSS